MKVTVVITTYNGEKYIEEQLQTIYERSYSPDEVIISDDGSKDSTIDIVRSFILERKLETTWKLIINEENKGYALNFLSTAMKANGDLIFFCDQDDIWNPDKIKIMKSIIEKENYSVLASNLSPFNQEDDTRKWASKDLKDLNNESNVDECVGLTYGNFHLKRSGCTMCIQKEFLSEIFQYWIPEWAHDDFVWKMAVVSGRLGLIRKILMKRRMHSTNATVIRLRNREMRIAQISQKVNEMKKLSEFCEKNENFENKMLKEILKKNDRCLDLRYKVVAERKFWYWPILWLRYQDCYPRIKGLYLDLYFVFKEEYKGV